ncbi:MAG: hypothetical protein Q4C81_06175 [Kocuria sp.]|nr:hypothetical protein [Kocuria sp.]
MVHPKTYAYGFCLLRGRSPKVLPSTYRRMELRDGFNFFYDSRRLVTVAQSATGEQILVHGRVHDLNEVPGPESARPIPPAQRLATALEKGERAFLEVLDHLAGRFVALRLADEQVWVYHDAMGTRSVYYLHPESSAAGTAGVASHAHLLAEVFDRGSSGVLRSNHTWDLSPYRGVRALLPNHRVEAASGRIERYWPYQPNQWVNHSAQERLDRVEALWSRQLWQATSSGVPVRFALGNGIDSYCALVLSLPWMSKISCFSHGSAGGASMTAPVVSTPGSTQSVQSLVNSMRVDHTVFDHRDPNLRQLTAEEEDACERNSVDVHSRWLLPHYLTRYSVADQLVIRSNGMDIAEHKWASPKAMDVASAAKVRLVKRAAAAGVQIPGESLADHFTRAFEEQELAGQLHGYLASDLTQWEYRLGRWASELYNEIDIAFDSFVPMSCRALLEPLLAFDREQRAASYAYHELVKRTMAGPTLSGVDDHGSALHDRHRHAATSALPILDQGPTEEAVIEKSAVAEDFIIEGSAAVAAPVTDESDDQDSFVDESPVIEPRQIAHPLIVMEPNGSSHEVSSDAHTEWFAHVPLQHFAAGAAVYRVMYQCVEDGELFFDLHTTWAYPNGVQSFSYSVLADDTPVLTIPGSHDAGRLPVAVRGLSSGQTVRLAILVHKDRDRISWENASRVNVTDIRFDAKNHGLSTVYGAALGLSDQKRLPLPYPVRDLVPDTAESSSLTDKWAGDELAEN